MRKYFSITKIILITVLLFFSLDLILGKYVYKKFIRKNFLDVDTSFAIQDQVYDHAFSPSYKGLAGWGNIRVQYCTDANGFRSSCKSQFDDTKEFDIGFIGDSFTEAVGIDFEKSFVGIISSNLPSKKIANLAVSSYSTSIYYAKINHLLKNNYKFKEIIVFVDIGDIVDDTVCYKLDREIVVRRKEFEGCFSPIFTAKEKINKFFKSQFRLSYELYSQVKIRLIKNQLLSYSVTDNQINNRRSDWLHNYKPENYNNYSYDEAKDILIFNMEKLAKLLRKNNTNLSVAVYPWPGTLKYNIENNDYLNMWQKFCSSNCKNFYNFLNPFYSLLEKEDFPNVIKKVYIQNDTHFSEEGNKIIADSFLKLYND